MKMCHKWMLWFLWAKPFRITQLPVSKNMPMRLGLRYNFWICLRLQWRRAGRWRVWLEGTRNLSSFEL